MAFGIGWKFESMKVRYLTAKHWLHCFDIDSNYYQLTLSQVWRLATEMESLACVLGTSEL